MGDLFKRKWATYCALLPQSAGLVQVQETRRAFYAGGAALFHVIVNELDPGDEPTEADLKKMDALKEEFDQFARDLADGKA